MLSREALKSPAATGWQLCAGTQKLTQHSDVLMGVSAGLCFEAVVALVRRTMCVDADKNVRTDWFHAFNETFIKGMLLRHWDLGKLGTFTINWWADYCDPLLRAMNTNALSL